MKHFNIHLITFQAELTQPGVTT